jgi:hypothetical protein
MCGVESVGLGIELYRAFFSEYSDMQKIIESMN